MNKQKIENAASIAEIVAAIGVIISVIYLAIQINAGNEESRRQTYTNTLTLLHAPLEQMIADPELARIIRVGGLEPDALSEDDWFRYSYWWLTEFDVYDYLYDAYVNNDVQVHLWQGTDASWRHVFKTQPGVRRAWREWRHVFQNDFGSYVDKLVNEAEAASAQ